MPLRQHPLRGVLRLLLQALVAAFGATVALLAENALTTRAVQDLRVVVTLRELNVDGPAADRGALCSAGSLERTVQATR